MFSFLDSVLLLLVSRLVQGLGGGTIGVVQAHVTDSSPPDERTRSIGWLTTVTSLGWVGFPLLAGFMMDRFGRGSPYWIAALLVLATLPLTATLEKIPKASPRSPIP